MDDRHYLLNLIKEGESQKPEGAMMPYDDTVRQLLSALQGRMRLNQIVRQSRLPRHRVIVLLASLIRFGTVHCAYSGQTFLFSQNP